MCVSTTQLLGAANEILASEKNTKVIHDDTSVTLMTGERILQTVVDGVDWEWCVADDDAILASGQLASVEEWCGVIKKWLPVS